MFKLGFIIKKCLTFGEISEKIVTFSGPGQKNHVFVGFLESSKTFDLAKVRMKINMIRGETVFLVEMINFKIYMLDGL